MSFPRPPASVVLAEKSEVCWSGATPLPPQGLVSVTWGRLGDTSHVVLMGVPQTTQEGRLLSGPCPSSRKQQAHLESPLHSADVTELRSSVLLLP